MTKIYAESVAHTLAIPTIPNALMGERASIANYATGQSRILAHYLTEYASGATLKATRAREVKYTKPIKSMTEYGLRVLARSPYSALDLSSGRERGQSLPTLTRER